MKRLVVVLATIAAVLALAVPTASAGAGGSVTKADPKDAIAQGDIRALRVSQNGATFTLRVRMESPLNIQAAAAWQGVSSKTNLRFNLETHSKSPGVDFAVVVKADGGDVSADLLQFVEPMAPSTRGGCVPVVAQPQPDMISVSFDYSCLHSTTVRAWARFRFDKGGNGTIDSTDRAPNTGTAPQLVLVTH